MIKPSLFAQPNFMESQAQCIDRLMEAFAGQQYEQGKDSGQHPFVNADAAFTMAFSAIMLNTDLHNPQIQDHRRMTLDDFIRNNRHARFGFLGPRHSLLLRAQASLACWHFLLRRRWLVGIFLFELGYRWCVGALVRNPVCVVGPRVCLLVLFGPLFFATALRKTFYFSDS